MRNEHLVNEENFHILMDWLDPDRDAAGLKYEKIRRSLIKIFASRGCYEAETLADRAIDRVAEKVVTVAPDYVGDPALYFYGVAHKMHFEWLRVQHREQGRERMDTAAAPPLTDASDADRLECLESCLAALPSVSRELILEYYVDDKRARIDRRRRLADELGITNSALQIRMSRMRSRLHACVAKCLAKAR